MLVQLKLFRNILFLLFLFTSLCFSQQIIDSSLIIGEFETEKVIDGDTFRFKNLDRSTRLLGIDTEEMFKDKYAVEKTNQYKSIWPAPYIAERNKSNRPVKIESPFGYKTWEWTKELFKNVVRVRLEKEDNSRFIDMYGRYLVYVICIMKDETELNYNVEVVRKGYSPYYAKYGYSKRFHKEFTDAQSYAQSNKLGIWSGNEQIYPDYEERIIWWNRRGDAIQHFETKYKGKPGYLGIYEEEEYDKLGEYLGNEIIVFSSINEIMKNKEPYLIRTSVTKEKIFDIKIFSENYSLLPELEKFDGEYVYIKGTLGMYKDNYEIKLVDIKQIWIE